MTATDVLRPTTLDDVADRLENELPTSPDARPVWIILPSTQLIRELEQILLDRGRACVGLSLLTIDLAFERILATRGLAVPRTLSRRALQSLLEKQLRGLQSEACAAPEEVDYLLQFPSTQRGLLDVLDECRDYGLDRGSHMPSVGSAMGSLTLTLLAGQRRLLEQKTIGGSRAYLALDALKEHPGRVFVFWPGSRPRGSLLRLTAALSDVVWFPRDTPCTDDGIPSRAKSLFRTGIEQAAFQCYPGIC